MSISQRLRKGLIACVLLSTALSSMALTLGRSRGVALVGRPLDVAVQVALDSPGQAADLCPEADVFHGDSRVDASRVTARVEPASGQNAVVRVRSLAAVDEPVVTIYLRLGCTQKITRRYVLLAEEPGEFVAPAPAPALVPAPAPAAPRASVAVPAPAPGPARRDTSASAAAAASRAEAAAERRAAARARRAADAEAPAPAPARSQPVARATPRASRSRLSVDMLDLTPERTPQLRASSGLAGMPSSDEQVRVQAAALWRAINAQPEDVLRDLQRVQALETDLKGLRTLVAGNDRTLTEVREQLNQARQERSLTLAAIALLALLLAATVVTWWLRRGERSGAGEWWRRDAAGAGGGSPRGPVPGPEKLDLRVDESMFEGLKQAAPRGPVVVAAPPRPAARPVVPVPADSSSSTASSFNGSLHSSVQSGFQSSQVASMRMVKAEELVDIQQQADFFMSLGQTKQAIEVLESHIHNNTETSALVWLDLLAIYRSLKRPEDYEMRRADFQRVFNAQVPAYDSTPTVSGGLEDYPRALTRIAALWPSPKVLDVIEESIFRKPGMAGAEPFDLEAYRELVMLYNLGREVVQPESAPAEDWSAQSGNKSTFFETSMQPLSVARDRSSPETEDSVLGSDLDSGPGGQTGLGDMRDLDSLTDGDASALTTGSEFLDPQVPRPSPRLGLDIDLTVAPPADRPPLDSNSIDFELSEPDNEDGKSGTPGRAG